MYEIIGERYSYYKCTAYHLDIFTEKQQIKIFHAGSVHFADSYFAITLPDVEQG